MDRVRITVMQRQVKGLLDVCETELIDLRSTLRKADTVQMLTRMIASTVCIYEPAMTAS